MTSPPVSFAPKWLKSTFCHNQQLNKQVKLVARMECCGMWHARQELCQLSCFPVHKTIREKQKTSASLHQEIGVWLLTGIFLCQGALLHQPGTEVLHKTGNIKLTVKDDQIARQKPQNNNFVSTRIINAERTARFSAFTDAQLLRKYCRLYMDVFHMPAR